MHYGNCEIIEDCYTADDDDDDDDDDNDDNGDDVHLKERQVPEKASNDSRHDLFLCRLALNKYAP